MFLGPMKYQFCFCCLINKYKKYTLLFILHSYSCYKKPKLSHYLLLSLYPNLAEYWYSLYTLYCYVIKFQPNSCFLHKFKVYEIFNHTLLFQHYVFSCNYWYVYIFGKLNLRCSFKQLNVYCDWIHITVSHIKIRIICQRCNGLYMHIWLSVSYVIINACTCLLLITFCVNV